MTASRMIDIATIDAGGRLRALDPNWVTLLAEEIGRDGQTDPIRVVERGEGFKLVAGARRLAAVQSLGRAEIEARVEPASALADEAAIQLAEIKADMLRGELTMLDRARYLAAWRDIHETLHPRPKRGRKPADVSDDALEEMSAQCANIFSEAAKAAFGFSQRTIYLLLKIASIDAEAARRISLHPVSDIRGELLALADQTDVRQAVIVDMLTAEPATALRVTDAIALLDSAPARLPEPAYARMAERFSRLPETEKFAFFALHESAIDLWIAKRSTRALKAVG